MPLSDLLKKHDDCSKQLVEAIENDAGHSVVQAIDAQLVNLVSSIENLDLNQPEEILKQIKFFLAQANLNDESESTRIHLEAVDKLVSKYVGNPIKPNLKSDSVQNISSKFRISLLGNNYSSKEMIHPSKSRISLFSTEFRYQFTSHGNAKFYNAAPSEFVGKHLVEVIGEQRFTQRAKFRLENCFAGIEQRYIHFLPVEGKGERLMDCHMAPYYDMEDSIRGAFVAMEDITDKLENAQQQRHIN